jgi:hypothetical protein
MIRNLKTLGLAMLALCAFGAVAAQAASAHQFTSESGATILTGAQVGEHVFTAEGNEVRCTTATFSGTQLGTESDQITIHPEYGKGLDEKGEPGKCRFSALTATVTTTGCNYVFDSDTTQNPDAALGVEDAPVSIECETGKAINIAMSGCTIAVGGAPNNQGLHGVTFANDGTGSTKDVTVNATASTIHYSASGFGCGLAGIKTGTHTDGTYTGLTTVKGYVDVNGVEGAQTGISVD